MTKVSFNAIRLALIAISSVPVMALLPPVINGAIWYKSVEMSSTCVIPMQLDMLKDKESQILQSLKTSPRTDPALSSVISKANSALTGIYPGYVPNVLVVDTEQPMVLGLVTSVIVSTGVQSSGKFTSEELHAWFVRESFKVINEDAEATLCKQSPSEQARVQKKGELNADVSAASYLRGQYGSADSLRSLLVKLKTMFPIQHNVESSVKPSVDSRLQNLRMKI